MKHASIISTEEEALWEQGILGCDNPKSLLRAVFYLNGKLRGGSEHQNLKLSQLQKSRSVCIYTENSSKNRTDKLSEQSVANKHAPIISTYEQVGECCNVYLLDMYTTLKWYVDYSPVA